LDRLLALSLVRVETAATGQRGRPAARWFAIASAAQGELVRLSVYSVAPNSTADDNAPAIDTAPTGITSFNSSVPIKGGKEEEEDKKTQYPYKKNEVITSGEVTPPLLGVYGPELPLNFSKINTNKVSAAQLAEDARLFPLEVRRRTA
jgi:hypothetical protein